jgi:hypothetical protein
VGDVHEPQVAIACGALHPRERRRFVDAQRADQDALCLVDDLAVFEHASGTGDLRLERLELRVSGGREADGGIELPGVDRLGQERLHPGGDRAVHQAGRIEPGEHHDRAPRPGGGQLSSELQAVGILEVDVEQQQLRVVIPSGRADIGPAGKWPDHHVTELLEPPGDTQRDDRIVFSDQDAHLHPH